MTSHSQYGGSSSSTSTSISLRARNLEPSESAGSPRKRTWASGTLKAATNNSGTSLATAPFHRPGLTLEASLGMLSLDNTPQSPYDAHCEQLREHVQKLRAVPFDKNYIDTACREYNRTRLQARQISEALLRQILHDQLSLRLRQHAKLLTSHDEGAGPNQHSAVSLPSVTRMSFGSMLSGDGFESPHVYEQYSDMIQGWIGCLENLLSTLGDSLVDTYKSWESEASPAMIEQILCDPKYRVNIISRLQKTSKRANWETFRIFDTRFRDYDQLRTDITEMKSLLQNGESGISPDRNIEEVVISESGDSILQFVNRDLEDLPVFRFRVSSHILTETSPVFAQLFRRQTALIALSGEENDLPVTPTAYTYTDGTEVQVYRMPQLESNAGKSFEILLHAAHMHNDKVPREINFDTFVAIAEVCMRYQCTAPLELLVEYMWLPQWLHKANEDMPDGLLLISYAFGMRTLFTRMSKTVILNITDHDDLESKPWPRSIKDKVWAMRNAKIGQVYHCCNSILQEYLRCPPATPPLLEKIETDGLVPTVKPRCVKGSHSCDAACLGWLMMLFNELHILPQIMYNNVLTHRPPPPRRSLLQLVNSLRFTSSPLQIHTGPCDFAPAFRAAINDIHNSVSGLTLFEVSGKHGWALSRHKSMMPQPIFKIGAPPPDHNATKLARQEMVLKIMLNLDDLDDVYNVALVNKAFFKSFKDNELLILRGLIGKTKDPKRWTIDGAGSKNEARAEMRLLRGMASLSEGTEPTGTADIEEGLNSVNISFDDEDKTPESQSVFEDDSDVDQYRKDLESDGLVKVIKATHCSLDDKMTREEAERILWPDNDKKTQSPPANNGDDLNKARNELLPVSESRQTTEKFLAADLLFQSIEEKTLITKEEKNLSDEHYERIGLRRAKVGAESDILSDWV